MKVRLLISYCCVLLGLNVHAQLEQKAYDSIRPTLPQEYAAQLDKLQSNANFLKYTLQYADMSWACPPHTDIGNPTKGWYILSADILPQFVIGGPWMKYPIHLTPRFKVRIFHDDLSKGDSSLPVRTPSFMPGGTIYIPFHSLAKDPDFINYGSMSFFHHSNGQDGPELDATGHFNKYNGNFSTNFLEAGYHFRVRKIFPAAEINKQCTTAGYMDWFGKAALEIHVGTEETLKQRYGLYRLNLKAGRILVHNKYVSVWDKALRKRVRVSECYLQEQDRVIFNLTFIGGSRTPELSSFSRRINFDLGYFFRIPNSPNASIFAMGGYYGSDPYNVYFDADNYFFLRVGIALGFHIAPTNLQARNRDIDPTFRL